MKSEVLIVDDSTIDLEILENLLVWQEFTVTKTHSGLTALDLLAKHESAFEIIILDWDMPEMSGQVLCQKIRGLQRRIRPYILMLSGSKEPNAQLDALASGADTFLAKPYKPKLLLATLQAVRSMIEHQKVMLKAAETDAMTQLLNHGAGLAMASKQLNRFLRFSQLKYCLVLS